MYILEGSSSSNISTIEFLDEEMEMCEISVEGECYYANGILVHNSTQELRIPAVMSGEPAWLNAFIHKDDVHASTAIAIWGEENYSRDKRQMAKVANFGLLYGGTKYTLADKLNIPLDEAEEFYNKYRQSLPVLFAWSDQLAKMGRRHGTIKTYFGRPRRVRQYMTSSDYRERAFGARTCVNSTVQGTAADITKLAMIRCWQSVVNNPEYKEDCWFLSTIHDEINFAVRESRIYEILPLLLDAMALQIPGWPIRMEVGIEIGYNWGEIFPFNYENGSIVPDMQQKKTFTEEPSELDEVLESFEMEEPDYEDEW